MWVNDFYQWRLYTLRLKTTLGLAYEGPLNSSGTRNSSWNIKMIQNVQNMQKLSKLIPKSSNFDFSATNHWVLPGSVGHPPESHHGQGDHLSRGLFVSGVDVVLKFHRVSGHHCQGSIDSSKIIHPFLQSSYATGGTVWIVPSSNKIFQWSRAFLTTAAPICYNHAYISKQQLFCSKSASLPIAF